MKHFLRLLSLAPVMALALASTSAYATTTATVYEGATDTGNAADHSSANETAASATFDISGSGISYDSRTSSYSNVSTFLNNPTYLTMTGTFNPSAGVDNTFLVINGLLALNNGANSVTITHDDGLELVIPGISYDSGTLYAGATSPTPTTFNITDPSPTGPQAFTLYYGECCGAPAVLDLTVDGGVVGATPEPSSIVMLGSGLLAAAGMVRRRFVA